MEVRYLKKSEIDKWNKFVEKSVHGSIFSEGKWLDIVSNDYEILVVEENSIILGGIVLTKMKKYIYRMPKLTPKLGILLNGELKKLSKVKSISKEMEITKLIIDNLPKSAIVDYNFSNAFTNYLPIIWSGYNVKLKYSCVLDDIHNLDKIYADFSYDTKYLIKRALKNNIEVEECNDVQLFYDINKKTFERQKMKVPYKLELLRDIFNGYRDKNAKMFIAKNSTGESIACLFLLFDEKCAYYLMGGADPQWRKYGSQTLLIWEAIKFASTRSLKFDFEGSMIQNIERSFREFGTKQEIYYNVEKSNFMFKAGYKFLRKNKNLIRRFIEV